MVPLQLCQRLASLVGGLAGISQLITHAVVLSESNCPRIKRCTPLRMHELHLLVQVLS
jgi:hypothetical protein